MDIYRFFNSRDVASYLRETEYEFSMPEAAFIVYLSLDATLDEKIEAWREIVETMPDCGMDGRRNMDPIRSFKAFLRSYIELERKIVERFFEPDGCVYGFSYSDDGARWYSVGNLFSSAESCLQFARDFLQKHSPAECHLEKRKIDWPELDRTDCLYLNSNFEIIGADLPWPNDDPIDRMLFSQFDGMWFAIPTPFKRGDIVRDVRRPDDGLFVLDWLPTWGKAGFLANGFREGEQIVEKADWTLAHFSEDGDVTDMMFGAFAMGDDGILYREHMGWTYFELEYASALASEDRWATVVSAYLKHEIGFDGAQSLLQFLRIDEEAKKLCKHCDCYYDERYHPDGVWQKIKRYQ